MEENQSPLDKEQSNPINEQPVLDEPVCTACNGTGFVPAVGPGTYEGERDFCVWCYYVEC